MKKSGIVARNSKDVLRLKVRERISLNLQGSLWRTRTRATGFEGKTEQKEMQGKNAGRVRDTLKWKSGEEGKRKQKQRRLKKLEHWPGCSKPYAHGKEITPP
ncbi:uncharacterized protein LOC143264499 [Megachile rotundata]|uniref:uncharacterized protein LOC143264499 n=1 Tax=Megachile rotundata TaxID=143995 RepID=UPI003FD0F094